MVPSTEKLLLPCSYYHTEPFATITGFLWGWANLKALQSTFGCHDLKLPFMTTETMTFLRVLCGCRPSKARCWYTILCPILRPLLFLGSLNSHWPQPPVGILACLAALRESIGLFLHVLFSYIKVEKIVKHWKTLGLEGRCYALPLKFNLVNVDLLLIYLSSFFWIWILFLYTFTSANLSSKTW